MPDAPEHPFISPRTQPFHSPPEGKKGWPILPGYEVLEELGEGGMGVVFKARQLALNRLVAIKMVSSSHRAGAEGRKRFRAEARAIAKLQHPNIVQVFDVGEYDGQPYFSLELCPGGALDRRLATATFEPGAAAELVEVLARAVHAAHQAGVIHRDLKPGNILYAADGTPKLTDFGLAKQLDLPAETWFGAIMGTPSYMAPEQASGAVAEIGPAADIYALGAILYELLTGRPPFKAATSWDTIALVCSEEPVPPARLQPRTPRDLETICLKCLNKQQGRRYSSAEGLANDLQRFLRGEPIAARRTRIPERAWKWARRRPTMAALAGTILLACLGALIGGIVYVRIAASQATAALPEQFLGKVRRLFDQGKEKEAKGLDALADRRYADAHQAFLDSVHDLESAEMVLETNLAGVASPPHRDDLRHDVLERLKAVKRRLEELNERAQVQKNAGLFLNDLHFDVLFHQVSITQRDEAGNRAQILERAPKALALFGLAPSGPAEAVRALKNKASLFESPEQFTRVVSGCYEILLVWAEAEAQSPEESAASVASLRSTTARREGVRKALSLLNTAEVLAEECAVPTPKVFYLRRARYLDLVGDARAAKKAKARAERLPETALDHFFTGI